MSFEFFMERDYLIYCDVSTPSTVPGAYQAINTFLFNALLQGDQEFKANFSHVLGPCLKD